MDNRTSKRALLFPQDPTAVEGLAKYLVSDGWEILSNGPAAKVLTGNSIPYTSQDALDAPAQSNELFLATLRSIISTRLNDEVATRGANNIFLVCINLTKIPPATSGSVVYFGDYSIDLRYITLIRAAAQNYMNIIVLTDPDDYEDTVIQMMTTSMTNDYRLYLAGKALNFTAVYDATYSNYILFNGHTRDFPKNLVIPYKRLRKLSQGNNPQQLACLYSQDVPNSALSGSHKIQGKDISYNLVSNYFMAWAVVSIFLTTLKNPFEVPSVDCEGYAFSTLFTPAVNFVFVVAVKHGNIIGSALGANLSDAFQKAYKYSPEIFSRSCLGSSCVVDKEAALILADKPFYSIIAPDFTKDARKILSQNKNLRLVVASNSNRNDFQTKSIDGGILVQSGDKSMFKKWNIMTRRRPNQAEVDSLAFAVMINMRAKSDAVTIAGDTTIIGNSLAQPSRENALHYALDEADFVIKSGKFPTLQGSQTASPGLVLVSDTSIKYFPNDLERIHCVGVSAILEEGGSECDDELIAFCNEHNIALVFTRMRHITF